MCDCGCYENSYVAQRTLQSRMLGHRLHITLVALVEVSILYCAPSKGVQQVCCGTRRRGQHNVQGMMCSRLLCCFLFITPQFATSCTGIALCGRHTQCLHALGQVLCITHDERQGQQTRKGLCLCCTYSSGTNGLGQYG